jgi:hypothetical protein
MKLGNIEVSGIKRIVEGPHVCWERYRTRWVKFVNGDAIDGMSEQEMHDYLDDKLYDTQMISNTMYSVYRIWVHNETINVEYLGRTLKVLRHIEHVERTGKRISFEDAVKELGL